MYIICVYIYYIYMNYWKAPEKYEPTIPGRPGRRPHPGRPYSLSGCRPLFGGEPIQIYIYNILQHMHTMNIYTIMRFLIFLAGEGGG